MVVTLIQQGLGLRPREKRALCGKMHTHIPASFGQKSFILFNIADIWQTVPDSYKHNVRFQVEICLEKFQQSN